jgi:tRNA threonylcarbamoyl adenosine modification protein (Sua5/YciO/YrdC/YwlC family)
MQRRAELLPWGNARPSDGALAPVVAALERGEAIALPTETVYGLAARADSADAVARVARMKGRDGAQPLTWHVGGAAALQRFPRVSPMAQRLVERYWPGPLTLVLPGVARGVQAAAKDGWTGVRHPAHAAAEALLRAAPFPIVASSANLHGRPPLAGARAVLEAFGEELAFVIDGGPPALNEASVLLKVGPGAFELLRPGILDLAALRATAGLQIGFVCTGNTCRSPMAEGLARAALSARLKVPGARLADFGFATRSMGISAQPGFPASAHAVTVLREQGVDLTGHRSRMAVPEEVAKLDRVYAMTLGHLEALRMLLPPGKDRHCTLLDPEGGDISDPIGGPRDEYERAAEQIRAALARRIDEWA